MWDTSIAAGGDGGFFNETNADETPGKGQKTRRVQSVVPLCIRQIRDHTNDEFTLFGQPVQILSLVGIVRDFDVQTTKAIYQIEDHTGTIKAIWWLENDGENAPKLPQVKVNSYVQLFGSIRVQEGERMIMVLKMFPVNDCNVINTHLLQVIQIRLEFEAMANPQQEAIQRNNPGANLASNMSSLVNFGQNQDNNSGLNPMQQKIFDILRRAPPYTGIHKNEILKQFPDNQARLVRQELEFLINEGHAYSTIDSEHYTATDSF